MININAEDTTKDNVKVEEDEVIRIALQDYSSSQFDVSLKRIGNSEYVFMTISGKDLQPRELRFKKEHLYTMLALFGDESDHDRIADKFVKKTRITKYFKMIGIEASRDIAKGEFVNVPLEFTLNPETDEIIIGKGNINSMFSQRKLASFDELADSDKESIMK